ncbi:MAG: hypothetical protein HY923_11645 [Elusimicrobia bacterium]|nr:hypothetical protein [Elusimicrobiota bacterium]
MDTPEQEVQEGRKKRTVLLLAGGAASLLLPLLGVVYIKMGESKAARVPNASVMFDRREGGEAKVNVSQTVTINSAVAVPAGQSSLPVAGQAGMTPVGGGSSLDMVKGSNSYYQDKPAEAPKASTPTVAPAAPAPAPAPELKATAKKGGQKSFTMPKLQGTKSISNNFTQKSPKPTGGQGMTGVADPQAGKGGGDMKDMLKNIPGGIDNPEVQKLMQQNKK